MANHVEASWSIAKLELIEIPKEGYHSNRDFLTGLPNRQLFIDRLEHAILRTGRDKNSLSVLFLDLDNFKTINESLGHASGDKLIKEVAERLCRCLREADTISRLNGDEFAIVLEDIGTARESTLAAADRVIKALSAPYVINGAELFMTVSIGITFCPADGLTVEDMIKNADMAMYNAKEKGKNTFKLYKPDMGEKVVKRFELENNLRKAIERNQLLAYYQPKVSLKNGSVVGMEALMRWRRENGEIISPDDFIPLAEEMGLITNLDQWMLKTACVFTKHMRDEILRDLSVSVNVSINLSARDLERYDLVQMVMGIVEEAGLQPELLELEVTESAIIRNIEMAVRMLGELRDFGFNVSIDDFGTGYSSLTYLAQFPINILKIDKSFITNLPHDNSAKSIAKAIITMSHDMNIKVVAEGVETKGQLDFLRKTGCDEIQGFLFSKPLPEREIEKLLKEGKRLQL